VETLMALVIGWLYAIGLYMMLRRSMIKIIIGMVLLSHASNLLVFTSGGLTRAEPPIIAAQATYPEEPFADPLPQALVLTAIVIGFGVLAFALVLIRRAYDTAGTDDVDALKASDR
jgi:multicomponent Na+:H+ antiporter subunit C